MHRVSKKTSSKPLKQVIITGIIVVLLATAFVSLKLITIAAVHTGTCPVRTVHLSLLNGDLERFNQVKKETEERAEKAEEARKRSPWGAIAEGCSGGETYKLHIL